MADEKSNPYPMHDLESNKWKLEQEKTGSTNGNPSRGGYRDFDAGAPHDPNHQLQAPQAPFPSNPAVYLEPLRRSARVSYCHLGSLYCSIFLLSTIVALWTSIALAKSESWMTPSGGVKNYTTPYINVAPNIIIGGQSSLASVVCPTAAPSTITITSTTVRECSFISASSLSSSSSSTSKAPQSTVLITFTPTPSTVLSTVLSTSTIPPSRVLVTSTKEVAASTTLPFETPIKASPKVK